MEEKKPESNRVTVEQLEALMRRVLLPTPRPWLVILGIAIVLSLFEVTRNAEGTYVVNFRLTAITVLLVALVWLPFLLKVLALTGGGLKTAAGEASLSGLDQLLSHLDPGTQREVLSTYVAAVDVAESKLPAAEQPKLRNLRQGLENQLASLPPESQQARSRLNGLAELYEATRKAMPSGSERTLKMSSIVAQARAVAAQARYQPMEMTDLLGQNTDGSRIIALAVVQANPDPRAFSLPLDAITHSRSAFEQYQALRAAEEMLPRLDEGQKQQLAAALRDQRSGGPGKFITPDSDRWAISSRILAALKL